MRVVNSDLVIWCLLGNPNELLTYDERGMLRTCSPHIRFILVDCAQSLKECVCVCVCISNHANLSVAAGGFLSCRFGIYCILLSLRRS